MKKYDLKDVTFLFPIRLDSIIRLENLTTSVGFLARNFDTNIHVLHADKYDNKFIKRLLPTSTSYTFVEDYDEVFYRTMYINQMVRGTNTPIIAVWDADVIVPSSQILHSVKDIRNGIDISYPYDGHFYDTTSIIRSLYIKSKNMRHLAGNVQKMQLIYGKDMKGGAFLANRKRYIESGMENENFYGWGPEDFERYTRWKVLDYKISQINGNLYHLTHSRGNNSTFRSMQQVFSTSSEHRKTMCSNKEEILDYLRKENIL